MDKAVPRTVNLNHLLKKRWSPRAFSDKIPQTSELVRILEAARWSASCSNEQPWRFLMGIKGQGGIYQDILGVLDEGNQVWARSASVLILLCTKKTFTRNKKPNNWAEYDAGQAAAHLSIQAMELDIYVHQMAGFDTNAAAGLIKSEEDLVPVTAMALGYLGNQDQLSEVLRERETTERKRKDLKKIILNNSLDV